MPETRFGDDAVGGSSGFGSLDVANAALIPDGGPDAGGAGSDATACAGGLGDVTGLGGLAVGASECEAVTGARLDRSTGWTAATLDRQRVSRAG